MKNQRGVTLIALVVTIIVLIILAGVSIAILTGDNGIINNAKQAQKNQIEGEVRDQVTIAVASAKMYAEYKAIGSNQFYAQTDIVSGDASTYAASSDTDTTTGKSQILRVLNEELNGKLTNPVYTITGTAATTSGTTTTPAYIVITYTGSNYASATNTSGATISCKIKVEGNAFTFDTTYNTANHTAWKYVGE